MKYAGLYILGTSHPLQCGSASCTPESILELDTELRTLCQKLRIQRIAEEMTAEGLIRQAVTETIGQRVARDLKIEHHNVDLLSNERICLSIDDSVVLTTVTSFDLSDVAQGFRDAFVDHADGIRERCWVARILSRTKWPTLFICGSNHAVSIRRLWRRLGLDAKVVHYDYQP